MKLSAGCPKPGAAFFVQVITSNPCNYSLEKFERRLVLKKIDNHKADMAQIEDGNVCVFFNYAVGCILWFNKITINF